MNVYSNDEAREAAVKGDEAPLDLLSEEFTAFAKEEMEYEDREVEAFTAAGRPFEGVVLGFGTSFSPDKTEHSGHPEGTPPVSGYPCSICRWSDIAILKTEPVDGKSFYVLATVGRTIVPGESDRLKTTWTTDPMGVFRRLFVPSRSGNPPKIPNPNARAFRYAAEFDDGIQKVLEEYDETVPDVPRSRIGQGY